MSDRLARLTARKQAVDAEWEAEIRAQMAEPGASLRSVAKQAGVSYETVRRLTRDTR